MDTKVQQALDTKVETNVRGFLADLRRVSPQKGAEAAANWNAYLPELRKCRDREEVARLLVSFLERSLRSVADEAGAEEFHRLKYDTVGKMMKCMYALRVHRNAIKDYTKHLHSVKGKPLERGIRMADEKPFETPDEIEHGVSVGRKQKQVRADDEEDEGAIRPPITLDELRMRLGRARPAALQPELLAVAGFLLLILYFFVFRLLG